ncbi:MAG: DsrE family protein [Halobacteriota archaeon]|nr:DsrE family protein [Halobacteriota archaeon]
MANSILTIVTKPPYGTEEAFAGLRLALSQIAGGLVERSDVLLLEDGVFNVISSQRSDTIGMPSNAEAIEDLLEMECTVYSISEDLEVRGIATSNMIENISIIPRASVSKIVDEYEVTASF